MSAAGENYGHGDRVLLTRFNVRLAGAAPASDEWLRRRFNLFERYCLPSVRSQTLPPTHWLVFFDTQTPPFFRRKAVALESENTRIVWVDGPLDVDEIAEAVDGVRSHCRLTTTRLDNDDALPPWFMARMAQISRNHCGVISFPLGYQLANSRLYQRVYLQNPFITMANGSCSARTIFDVKHYDLRGEMVKYAWQPGSWLQVLHGDNIANEIRGVPIRPSRAAGRMPVLAKENLETLPVPKLLRAKVESMFPLALEGLNRLRRGTWRNPNL